MNFDYDSSASSSSSSMDDVNPNSESSLPEKRRAGRKKFKETRHPVYRGVRRRNGNKWVCEVREPNKKSRIWLGTFASPEMAARAHDVAALALKGDLALLNFPNSAIVLPRAKSSSPRDIRLAALEATKAFKPSICSSCSLTTQIIAPSSDHDYDGKKVFEVTDEAPNALFLDEEALFNMPALLDSMAEGLILTPPPIRIGFDWENMDDFTMDLNLWRD
ncbi:hypothetical protein SLE2022_354980 [Rubroshorea leprosula]